MSENGSKHAANQVMLEMSDDVDGKMTVELPNGIPVIAYYDEGEHRWISSPLHSKEILDHAELGITEWRAKLAEILDQLFQHLLQLDDARRPVQELAHSIHEMAGEGSFKTARKQLLAAEEIWKQVGGLEISLDPLPGSSNPIGDELLQVLDEWLDRPKYLSDWLAHTPLLDELERYMDSITSTEV